MQVCRFTKRLLSGVCVLVLWLSVCATQASITTDASVFAQKVATSVYHFDVKQARDWPQPVAGYFTPAAFRSFSKAMRMAEVPQQLEARHLNARAMLVGVAEVRAEGERLWQVLLPMHVYYENASERYHQSLLLNIRVAQIRSSNASPVFKVVQFSARSERCVALDRRWLD